MVILYHEMLSSAVKLLLSDCDTMLRNNIILPSPNQGVGKAISLASPCNSYRLVLSIWVVKGVMGHFPNCHGIFDVWVCVR